MLSHPRLRCEGGESTASEPPGPLVAVGGGRLGLGSVVCAPELSLQRVGPPERRRIRVVRSVSPGASTSEVPISSVASAREVSGSSPARASPMSTGSLECSRWSERFSPTSTARPQVDLGSPRMQSAHRLERKRLLQRRPRRPQVDLGHPRKSSAPRRRGPHQRRRIRNRLSGGRELRSSHESRAAPRAMRRRTTPTATATAGSTQVRQAERPGRARSLQARALRPLRAVRRRARPGSLSGRDSGSGCSLSSNRYCAARGGGGGSDRRGGATSNATRPAFPP